MRDPLPLPPPDRGGFSLSTRGALKYVLVAALILFPAASRAEAPQWRSDRQDPAAVFTYLGYRLGETLDEVKEAHGPFPYAKQLAPDAVLYADSDGIGYPLVTELYFVGGKLEAIKAMFDNQMTPPDEVEINLEAAYGPPQARETADWVDRFGNHVKSLRLTWRTPAGPLQFDNKFQRLNQGAVQVNPDLIEGLTNKNGL